MSFRCHLANNFDDSFCCHYIPDTDTELQPPAPDMSRPQSMPDFTALMDSTKSLFEATTTSNFEKRIHSRRTTSPDRRSHHGRKRPSLSLAAGLMMNTESPLLTGTMSPRKRSGNYPAEDKGLDVDEGGTLFYAYALRVSHQVRHSMRGRILTSNRATVPPLRHTFSHSPRLPCVRNGGALCSSITRRVRARAHNSWLCEARTWSS